jgi:DNA-binding response OmpR family regulator
MGDVAQSRRVLLLMEDETLAELLDETLTDAGHDTARLLEHGDVEAVLGARPFDVVIVDLDTRARDGAQLVARLRRWSPSSTIVALLPCGGLHGRAECIPYHLAIEKPARLGAVLSAINAAHRAK